MTTVRRHAWLTRACSIFTLLTMLLFWSSAFAQCALCQMTLGSASNSKGGSNLADGILWSTLVMMSTAFIVPAVIGALLFRAYRRTVQRQPISAEPSTSPSPGAWPDDQGVLQPQES